VVCADVICFHSLPVSRSHAVSTNTISFHVHAEMRAGCSKLCHLNDRDIKGKAGLDRSRGFQEFKVPRFRDNGTGWW